MLSQPYNCITHSSDEFEKLHFTKSAYYKRKTQGVPFYRSLLDLLRGGGYILYARHGEASIGEDQPYLNFKNCATQRNLSEVGRRHAITYGEAIRRLQIPVKFPVMASPFCRSWETAELAFGNGYVLVNPFWAEVYKLSFNINAMERERILNSLKAIFETRPPTGTNKVIIAHSFPIGVGLGQLPDMGTVVVKPLGEGKGYGIVAQVSLSDLVSWVD